MEELQGDLSIEPPPAFPIFRLPAELRNRIFELVLRPRYTSSVRHLAWNAKRLKVFHVPALLLASQQFQNEAWPVFLKVNIFALDGSKMRLPAAPSFEAIDQPLWAHLQIMHLRLECAVYRKITDVNGSILSILPASGEIVISTQKTLVVKLTKHHGDVLVLPKDDDLRLSRDSKREVSYVIGSCKPLQASPSCIPLQAKMLTGAILIRICQILVKGPQIALEETSMIPPVWKDFKLRAGMVP